MSLVVGKTLGLTLQERSGTIRAQRHTLCFPLSLRARDVVANFITLRTYEYIADRVGGRRARRVVTGAALNQTSLVGMAKQDEG